MTAMIYMLEQGDRTEMYGPVYPGVVYAQADGPTGAKAAAERHTSKEGGGLIIWTPTGPLTIAGMSPAGLRRRYKVTYKITGHRVQA